MKKRRALSIGLAVVFWCGAAYAVTFMPLVAGGTLVIHASGASSGVHVSGGVSSHPSGTTTGGSGGSTVSGTTGQGSVTLPSTGQSTTVPSLHGIAAPGSSQGGAGIAVSRPGVSAPSQGWISAPTASAQGGFADLGPAAARPAKVMLLDGTLLTAASMRAGLNDALRLRNGRSVTSVRLDRVASIEFGEKELGALPATITLLDGGTLAGSIYPGVVFEFEGEGGVTATRASAIASIEFPDSSDGLSEESDELPEESDPE